MLFVYRCNVGIVFFFPTGVEYRTSNGVIRLIGRRRLNYAEAEGRYASQRGGLKKKY